MANCCTECFKDEFLKELIRSYNKKRNCNYCNSKNVYVVNPKVLSEYFEPFLGLYRPINNYRTKKKNGIAKRKLWARLANDWKIFHNATTNNKTLLLAILSDYKNSRLLKNDVRLINSINIKKGKISELESRWDEFSNELKHSNRYFPDYQIDQDRLVKLLQYLEYKIPQNKYYYRARNSFKGPKYEPDQIGKPPIENTHNGRANPTGISYLYLASDKHTSITEIRPSLLDKITVGRFKIKSEIILIDLRYISPFNFVLDETFEDLIKDIRYLEKLGSALSKPLNPLDTELEYLPTQYLCEFIKRNNWDGVLYQSSLSSGFNLALFSDDKVQCLNTQLYQVTKLDYRYIKVN